MDALIAAHCPGGVEHKALGKVGEFVRGNGLQKSDLLEAGVGAIHYGQIHTHYGAWARTTKSFVSEALASKLRRARPGDLVIATTSEDDQAVAKAVAWVGEDEVAVSGDAYIFRHQLEPKYASYFFQTDCFQAQKRSRITGTKVRRISGDSLAKILVPVPPLEIQREIVAILDRFTKLEAELKAELEAELKARRQQYRHYRAALLNFNDRENCPIVTTSLRDIVHFINAKPHEKFVDPDGEVALITPRFVSTQGRKARFVKAADVLTPANSDDIALVMSDLPNGKALAKAFYVDKDDGYAANQRVCLLRIKDISQINPRFLFYVIDRNPQLLKYDSGFDQTHLKKDWILDIRIPVPSLEEQDRIVSILDEFEELTASLSNDLPAEIGARRQQYEYYRDRLMTFKEAA